MTATTIRSLRHRWRWPAALIAVLALIYLSGTGTDAHAAFDRSDPLPNSILAAAPDEIRIWFTEPLEHEYNQVALFDQNGNEIEGLEPEPGEGTHSLLLPIDRVLPNGTYSVVWENLSAADGHPAQGYFTFTVGSQADVAAVVSPVDTADNGPPLWLRAASRWLVLLTLAPVIAAWPIWLIVLRPAAGKREHEQFTSSGAELSSVLSTRVRTLTFWAIAACLVANLLALVVQGASLPGDDLPAQTWDALTDTRYGRLWIARIALLLAMAVAIRAVRWPQPFDHWVRTGAAIAVALLLPLPISMNAHAAALDEGRTTAIGFDYTHILAASIWFGGLMMLIGVLFRSLDQVSVSGRRGVLALALPRFSATALCCWGLLILTGLYAWWLQVGSLDALWDTQYGQSLLAKLALLAVVLLIAAANLLLVTRKVSAPGGESSDPRWYRRLTVAVAAEIALTALVLFAVGRMTSLEPARSVVAAQQNSQELSFDLDGQPATLVLTPGAAGPNHYLLTISGVPTPDGTEALLRLTYSGQEIGQQEIRLDRAGPATFEGHGSEIGIAGAWEVETIVRDIGNFDWHDTEVFDAEPAGAGLTAPKPPWRFGAGGMAGLLLIAIGLFGFVVGWQAGKTKLRSESGGLGVAAVLLGAVLLSQSRIQPAAGGIDYALANPVAPNIASIERGEANYLASCLVCHGAGGNGDGPGAAGLVPPPADFTSPHALTHVDGELFSWIRDGKPGTEMPAFGDTLSDDQIWEVITYMQIELQQKPVVEATPVGEIGAKRGN